jgi:hypothetical protein
MTFCGGALIGFFSATWPFAELKISSDAISLKVFFIEYTFTRLHVYSIEFYKGIFSRGIKIIHDEPGLNMNVVFWSFTPTRVLEEAQRLGYNTNTAEQDAAANP